MASVKSFEDLEVWQRTRKIAHEIFELTLEEKFSKDFSLKDQIERGSNKEFILFLSYSKGSAGEARSQLYRALDRNYINQTSFNRIKQEIVQISKMLSGLMQYLQQSSFRGSKFNEPEAPYGNLNLSYSIDDED